MKCCEKALTDFIIREALLMRGQHGGDQFAQEMIDRAGIERKNPEDLKIIKDVRTMGVVEWIRTKIKRLVFRFK